VTVVFVAVQMVHPLHALHCVETKWTYLINLHPVPVCKTTAVAADHIHSLSHTHSCCSQWTVVLHLGHVAVVWPEPWSKASKQ